MTNILRKLPWWSGDRNTTTIDKAVAILGSDFVCDSTQTLAARIEPMQRVEAVLYSLEELVSAHSDNLAGKAKNYLVYIHGLSHAKLYEMTRGTKEGWPRYYHSPEYPTPWWLNPKSKREEWAYKGIYGAYYLIDFTVRPNVKSVVEIVRKKRKLLASKILRKRAPCKLPGHVAVEAIFSLYLHFGIKMLENGMHGDPTEYSDGLPLRFGPFDGEMTVVSTNIDRPRSGFLTYLPPYQQKA